MHRLVNQHLSSSHQSYIQIILIIINKLYKPKEESKKLWVGNRWSIKMKNCKTNWKWLIDYTCWTKEIVIVQSLLLMKTFLAKETEVIYI